ncbi:MAG: dihydroorotase [Rickettsiales bacterium]|jgi:dihydroorotase|nr:dihydroorotase [Rickettsiales bacterium]
MSQPLFLTNAIILDPKTKYRELGNMLIENGKIIDFGPNIQNALNAEEIDCKGKYLIPGLVDIQVHFRDPGVTQKEDLITGSKSAVAGGITSVVCQPNTNPVIDNDLVIDYINLKAKSQAKCNIFFYGAVTKGMLGQDIAEIGMMKEKGAVGFTDDGLPVANSYLMRRAFEYAKTYDTVIAQHAEDLGLTNGGSINDGEISQQLGLAGISNSSESAMVARDIEILRETDSRYHVLHVSTKESMALIIRAKQEGLNISCEVSPHHISLTDAAILEHGADAKMNPPLRSNEDREFLIQALKDGYVDAIATDHAPHEASSKKLPVDKAPFGIVGLETMLPVSMELVHQEGMDLLDVLALLTYKPSEVLKLNKGVIAKGADADLALIDFDHEWIIDREKFSSKSNNTPFHGRKVKGKNFMTIMNGKVVFEDGE